MSKRPPPKKRGFHGLSFLGGLLLGAVVFSAIFAPQLTERFAKKFPDVVPGQDDIDVVFEFPQLLRQSEVPVDPSSYDTPPDATTIPDTAGPNDAPPRADASSESIAKSVPARVADIYIQAASFRDAKEADLLRAQLLLQGLPANQGRVVLGDGTWHRVTVGPIESSETAEKIIDRLREQNLYAIRINPQ